jgi:hypothetical protein
MRSKSKKTSGLPASTHGVPKEYIERVIPDPIIAVITIPGETTTQSLAIHADLLTRAVAAAAGAPGSLVTKEHLLAATETKYDEAKLAEAEREVVMLFEAVSLRFSEEEARRIFACVLARPEGRPRKTKLCLIDPLC